MLGSLDGHRGDVYSARFSPDGQRIVTAGADGTVRVWDPSSANTVAVLRGPGGTVTEARFSPDGAQIIGPRPRYEDADMGCQRRRTHGRIWSVTAASSGARSSTQGPARGHRER